MNVKSLLVSLALGAVAVGGAQAAGVTVINPSFEILPDAGLPDGGCGVGCSYSVDAIPGWSFGAGSGAQGQFQPGPASGNFNYFNYVPDGLTVAYSNGGTIFQTVSAAAHAGAIYTLTVDVGLRNDGYPSPTTEQLIVGGNAVTASGVFAPVGNWATFTAVYTATGADAGKPIEILLSSTGAQGDWDNVVLTSSLVPEPAAWALMLVGFGGLGAAMRARRRRTATAA